MKISVQQYAAAYLAATENASREQVRTVVETLVGILRRNQHTRLLSAIVAEVERQGSGQTGPAVLLTSAHELTSAEQEMLLKNMGIDRERSRVQAHVDPAVGSGVRVQVGDQVVDATFAAKMHALRAALL
jgi:F0F1-type ATP synthase delta subunit